MFKRNIFSTRFKTLRTAHLLSMLQLADLLGLKSSGSVSNFETQKMIPSSDVLLTIADLFAISIDWLVGRSNIPYSHETILELEEQHLQRLALEIDKDENLRDFGYNYVEKNSIYLNPDMRFKNFSLPVRANIIFLLSWCQIETDFFNTMQFPFKNNKFSDVIKRFIFIWESSESTTMRRKIAMKHFDELGKLLTTREITTPIFDITKKTDNL
jgi:Helix-turn-helix.